jgi:hypothetical protein
MPALVAGMTSFLGRRQGVDGRSSGAKTRFALLPGHDD